MGLLVLPVDIVVQSVLSHTEDHNKALDQIEEGCLTVKMAVVDGIVMGPAVSIN